MSSTKLLCALFLAAPAALLTGGCSAESQPTTQKTTTVQGPEFGSEDGDHGHDHASHEGGGHDGDHGHDHSSGDGHDHDADGHEHATGGETATAANLPEGHTHDDGHDHSHGADDGHDHSHGADDGHDHDHGPQALGFADPDAAIDGESARLVYPIGQESKNFGRLMQGSVVEHTFELSNEGTQDLIIKQVKPTCGCTVAQVQTENAEGAMVDYTFGDPIPKGRKVHIPAKMHTKNKTGHQTVRLNVFSNDPRGTIQLGLEADIDPFFNVAPRFLNFGKLSVGDEVNKKAVISTSKGNPVALNLVEQSLPAGAVCELTPVNPDGEGRAARWDLSVTLGPDLAEGNLARAITVTSDEAIPGGEETVDGKPQTYQATLTLSAQVVGPFSYNPPYISMGLVRPGQVATRHVTVESHDEEFNFAEKVPNVKIVGLQNPGTDTYRDWEYSTLFTPTITPVEGKNAIDIELRLEGMPDTATGSFRGTMIIELGHPEKENIPLVVTGVCRGGPAPQK